MTRPSDPAAGTLNRRQSEPVATSNNSSQISQKASFPLTPTTGSSTVVSPDGASSRGYTAMPPSGGGMYSMERASSASVIAQPRTARDKEASLTLASLGSKTAGLGFFGPTSFSAVFAENRENLGGNDDIPITNERVPYIHADESLASQM